jgi:endonuclease YncB( thermonuclease family)
MSLRAGGFALVALCGLGVAAVDFATQAGPAPVSVAPETVPPGPANRESAPPSRRAVTASLPADVLRVIDGDTFEARVHVWPGLDITTRVRLRGIDAPELRARCPAERVQAEAARDALAAILADGAVTVSTVALDKYGGRVVADASTRQIPNVSAEMLGRGLARSYGGGRREGWCGDK